MFPRTSLVIIGLLAIAIITIGALFYARGPFAVWSHHMAVGASYMKSLKESDMPPWIERTKRLLTESPPDSHSVGVYGQGGKPIPADLQQLGIIRVDIFQDQVCYVWMGGMDHTDLEVDRLPNDRFRLIAHYNDFHSRVIWESDPRSVKPLTDLTRR